MNVLFLFSDQHGGDFLGMNSRTPVETPHLDALAARGTLFTDVYCTSPMCVPSRASLISGRYAHEVGAWDNTCPYAGDPPGWYHHLRAHGVQTTVIGKLDTLPGADIGVDDWRNPKVRSSYDIIGLYRAQIVPRRRDAINRAATAPRGRSKPFKETARVDEAVRWLREERPEDKPWMLQLNFHAPHPKWAPRQDLFDKYMSRITKLPEKYYRDANSMHVIDRLHSVISCGGDTSDEELHRNYAAYCAVCEELDEEIGRLLTVLEELNEVDQTLVVYASDHGESLGAHRAWNKGSLREDSVRVPLIMAGPGANGGRINEAPTSLLNVFPTIAEAVGVDPLPGARGHSLLNVVPGGGAAGEGFVFSEFHGNGTPEGTFMIRKGPWKLIDFVTYAPMLFNLRDDPDEMVDLLSAKAPAPEHQRVLAELRADLHAVCDPPDVDRKAKADQQRKYHELYDSGRIQGELARRGYEPTPYCLTPGADEG